MPAPTPKDAALLLHPALRSDLEQALEMFHALTPEQRDALMETGLAALRHMRRQALAANVRVLGDTPRRHRHEPLDLADLVLLDAINAAWYPDYNPAFAHFYRGRDSG